MKDYYKQNNIYARTSLLLGDEAINKLKNSRVAIIGLGGVGSYATEVIARTGIGKILLVDFDEVSLSNINRQLPALHSTVGIAKTEVMKQRILDINPNAEVEIYNDFAAKESRPFLLNNLDIVIDAIDGLGPKVGLIEDCVNKNIPIVSSMGAAGRIDPSQIKLDNIFNSYGCSLAKRVRKYLRRRGITTKIPVVFSTEEPQKQFPAEYGSSQDAVSCRGRERGTLSSISYLPAIMGMWVASYAIRFLIGKPPEL